MIENNTELLQQVFSTVSGSTYHERVNSIKNMLKSGIESNDIPEGEAPVEHYFAPNVYMRQMNAKKDTLVVSKMHRTEHLNIFLSGSVSIITENGIEHLKAPIILKSAPGTQRIGYFHEDSSWLTVHPTESTVLTEIEDQVIVPEYEVEAFLKSINHASLKELQLCRGEQ